MLSKPKKIRIGSATVDYYFGGGISQLKEICEPAATVLITDENVYAAHAPKFRKWRHIVLPPGEAHKQQETVSAIIRQLMEMEADRKTCLVGVGGGVITDITGYAASTYMRGVRFGFVPSSLLAMVDASIGGKNGVDVGSYKNLVGVIRQPSFLLYDMQLLSSLPEAEWQNGFAEIIKHAAIRDAAMFRALEAGQLKTYRQKKAAISELVQRNALLKTKVVQADEQEAGERRLLNFGHTLGHAIENKYGLPHGHAVAIGMVAACRFSEQLKGFKQTDRMIRVLAQYGLPTELQFDRKDAAQTLRLDKKRERQSIHYILLEKIGKAVVENISLTQIEELIDQL